MLQCPCIIYLNILKITKKQQEVYGIMNQLLIFLLILNLLNIKQVLQGKITDNDDNQIDNLNYDANKVGKNETEVVVPLKHLSNFWRSLNTPLTNSEVELILIWSKNCVLDDEQ